MAISEIAVGAVPQVAYEDHLTFFVDLLGFSEIAQNVDQAQMVQLLGLLRSMADMRGEFSITRTPQQNGETVNLRPAITTFSDHVVISFPLRELGYSEGIAGAGALNYPLLIALGLIARLAAAALGLNLLVRGGATVGKLYHSQGVAFGEALIEAYSLESGAAIYPRIVFAPKLLSLIQFQSSLVFAKDSDDVTHLNYFPRMLRAGGGPPGDHFSENMRQWVQGAEQIIDANIQRLHAAGRVRERAKWAWFKNRFDDARRASPAKEFLEGAPKQVGSAS